MAARKGSSTGQGKNAQQGFLSKPAKRRRRPAQRRKRQEQTRVVEVRPQEQRPRSKVQPARPQRRISVVRSIAALLAIGLLALVVLVFTDTRFYVQTAAIRGLRNTSAEQIYRQADIDQYSIFWINERETERRIEALPYVKRATVHTALPNQVRIEIVEREPVVIWKIDGQEFWVDNEGITMPVANLAIAQDLPVLWDLDSSTAANDGRLDPQLIASLRQVKQQAPEVTDFGYDRINGLQFRFPSGSFVYLGHPEGMAKRVASLLVLHQSLASQGQAPAEINWRFENGYYLRLAQ